MGSLEREKRLVPPPPRWWQCAGMPEYAWPSGDSVELNARTPHYLNNTTSRAARENLVGGTDPPPKWVGVVDPHHCPRSSPDNTLSGSQQSSLQDPELASHGQPNGASQHWLRNACIPAAGCQDTLLQPLRRLQPGGGGGFDIKTGGGVGPPPVQEGGGGS